MKDWIPLILFVFCTSCWFLMPVAGKIIIERRGTVSHKRKKDPWWTMPAILVAFCGPFFLTYLASSGLQQAGFYGLCCLWALMLEYRLAQHSAIF
jgi:hypothetical protein